MFDNILTNSFLEKNIKSKLYDPWKNTKFQGYKFLSPASKGCFGENFVELYLKQKNFCISERKNKGHDRIINSIKTEIKFSLSKNKKFVLNHLSIDKDWERLIFCCVGEKEDDLMIYWFTKDDFLDCLKHDKIFKHQQGGKSINNDDYMCNQNILKTSMIKDLSEW